jgi:hypothetical protein
MPVLPMAAERAHAYTYRRRDQRSMGDADQAEVLALRRGAALVDEGVYDDLVAEALDDFENAPDEAIRLEFHGRDLAEDNGTGAVMERVQDRAKRLGSLYPFTLAENQLVHKGGEIGWYEFMLACSVQRDISSRPFKRLPQLFERISSQVATRLLGEGASALHVGHPRDAGLPTFKSGFERLNDLTGEWPWKPADDLPEEGLATGDDGLDFVAWRGAGGQQRGSIYLLGQCACGDDWDTKLTELSVEKIAMWTGGGEKWAVVPLRLFATSHVLADGWYIKDQKAAGLLLDRIRLSELEAGDLPLPADIRAEMVEITRSTLRLN